MNKIQIQKYKETIDELQADTNLVIINYKSCLFPTYHNQNN